MSDPVGYESPEAAALAGWAASRGVHARVISITVRGDRAEVVIEVGPKYPDHVYCVRRRGEWFESVSGNGPTIGWDDPSAIDWN